MSNAIATQIWSGFTNPNQIDKSGVFTGCDFILLNALGVGSDNLEIAAAVVIEVIADTLYLNGSVQVPQAPLGTKEIPLSISGVDTAVLVPLPMEATRSNCNCTICIATSYAVNLEIYAVSKKDLCECKLELDRFQNDLNFFKFTNTAIAINQAAQDAAIVAFSGGVAAALAPYTLGASLAIAPATSLAIGPGIAALAPLLLVGI